MPNEKSGAEQPKISQWTRAGVVRAPWGAYETFESLVFTTELQTQIQKLALGFLGSQDFCTKARLPWRRGAFVFGPAGCGKSAAARAISLLLGWQHITIPAHEIFDTHHLTRALFDVAAMKQTVVVLENIDDLFKRVDETRFFDIFDLASERADGVFWIATSRHPEDVPKNGLVRPGRFEESLRLASPSAEVKKKFYETYLEPFLTAALGSAPGTAKDEHLALLDQSKDLSFAHLQEMRYLVAKVLMDGVPEKLLQEIQVFCREQVIGADRWGGPASQAKELEERIKYSDPRLLISALQVTDAFKRVVELTVTSASEAILAAQTEK